MKSLSHIRFESCLQYDDQECCNDCMIKHNKYEAFNDFLPMLILTVMVPHDGSRLNLSPEIVIVCFFFILNTLRNLNIFSSTILDNNWWFLPNSIVHSQYHRFHSIWRLKSDPIIYLPYKMFLAIWYHSAIYIFPYGWWLCVFNSSLAVIYGSFLIIISFISGHPSCLLYDTW